MMSSSSKAKQVVENECSISSVAWKKESSLPTSSSEVDVPHGHDLEGGDWKPKSKICLERAITL